MAVSKTSISLSIAALVACLAVTPSSLAITVEGASQQKAQVVLIDQPEQAAKKKAAPKKKAVKKKAKKKAVKKKAAPKKKAKKKAVKKKAKKKAPAKKKAKRMPYPSMGDNGPSISLPEPSSFILLLAGFFAVGALVRRRANKT